MPDTKKDCMELARRVGEKLGALSGCRAVMVTGSTAKGLTDEHSDVDMTAYYESDLPPADELMQIRKSLGGGDIKWTIGDREHNSFAEVLVPLPVQAHRPAH